MFKPNLIGIMNTKLAEYKYKDVTLITDNLV